MQQELTIRKLREFAFFMSFALPLFAGLIYPTLRGHSFNRWTILTAIPFSFWVFLSQYFLKSLIFFGLKSEIY